MKFNHKILIASLIILFVCFFINLKTNIITGEGIKEITGLTTVSSQEWTAPTGVCGSASVSGGYTGLSMSFNPTARHTYHTCYERTSGLSFAGVTVTYTLKLYDGSSLINTDASSTAGTSTYLSNCPSGSPVYGSPVLWSYNTHVCDVGEKICDSNNINNYKECRLSSGCGNWQVLRCSPTGYVCSNGNCIVDTTAAPPGPGPAPTGPVTTRTCKDNDNGKIYDTRSSTIGVTKEGVTYTESSPFWDNCNPWGQLQEGYCDSEQYLTIELKNCGTGKKCYGGACVSETPTTPATIDCTTLNEIQCKGVNSAIDISSTTPCNTYTTIDTCNTNSNCEWFDELKSTSLVGTIVSGITDTIGGLFGGGTTTDAIKEITGYQTAEIGEPCQQRTKCVWTGEHCCGNKQYYDNSLGRCSNVADTAGELCFSFWPDYKIKDKSVKYSASEVCWDVGSQVYGYWTTVRTY